MIPRRLVLRNFLSYRQCDLDFTGLRLAVISGRNGDGKSALLDAIRWVVWGEARGRGDELINATQEEMWVRFDLESNGEHYEIQRKKTRNGSSQLDFFHHSAFGRKTLTTAGIRETEKEIVRHLRLDYDTFANSAFMAQGHAGDFTAKGPSERKDIFRNILGLQLYEDLKVRAADHRKTAETELKVLRQRAQQTTADLARLPLLKHEVAATVQRLAELEPLADAAQERAANLQVLAANFDQVREAATAARDALTRAERELESDTRELGEAERQLEAATNALEGAAEVEARHTQLQEARREEERLGAAQTAATNLQLAISKAEGEIAGERSRLETQAERLTEEVASLRSEASRASELTSRQAAIAAEEAAILAVRASVEVRRQAHGELAAGRTRAATEMAECIRRGNESKAETAEIERLQERSGAVDCPVCRRPLAPADIRHVLDEYSAHRRQLGEVYRVSKAEHDRINAEAVALQAEIERDGAECERRDTINRTQQRELAVAISRATEATTLLPVREQAHEQVLAALAGAAFAAETRQLVQVARAELDALAYDGEAHRLIRERVAALRPAERELHALEAARATDAAQRPRADVLRARLPARLAECARANSAAGAALADLESATDVGPQLREAQAELAAVHAETAALHGQRGGLEKERELLLARQAQLEEEQIRETALADEASVHIELEKAFGRDGIQAMLIDQSLPAVEETANRLLEKMTSGRIRVQLSTQKLLKSGKMDETLEINISDEIGVRPYAMYSGGEAFRVDFALRIALARLLAERAGAELPTLIIDEGFGSQDAEGIDRLVEAIQAVSEEFRLILVVTHVDALRDRFEQRIEVTKDAVKGSTARVVA